MAHTCPCCGEYCNCNGDVDDIDFGEDDNCTHCFDKDDDDEGDDDLDFDDNKYELCIGLLTRQSQACTGCDGLRNIGSFITKKEIKAPLNSHQE